MLENDTAIIGTSEISGQFSIISEYLPIKLLIFIAPFRQNSAFFSWIKQRKIVTLLEPKLRFKLRWYFIQIHFFSPKL